MSLLQGTPRSGAGQPGTGWQDRVLDRLLPHRGAIANARGAVEADRVAAGQRKQAALAVARAAGHPAGSDYRTAR